jgi:hypothetical protein
LGNKGVSEDWDGDFEFDDSDRQEESKRDGINSDLAVVNHGMKVPQAIMERQASVHGQFGHVQELTLLVEELKRLRLQASALHIIDGPSHELWREAKGIINLATQEEEDDDEKEFVVRRSPSSPTFNFEEFEDDIPLGSQPKKYATNTVVDKRRSLSVRTNSSPSASSPIRSGTESSARAKFVLDAIYQQRRTHDPIYAGLGNDQHQKLPFDTQSLRDLVVRAGVVARALKDIMHRAEGVSQTADAGPRLKDPPFSQIFAQPTVNLDSGQRLDRLQGESVNGYLGELAYSDP